MSPKKKKKKKSEPPPMVIVRRDEWGARPSPNNTLLVQPIGYIRYVYTRTEMCDSRESCSKLLQTFQEPFLRLNNQDMPYNFLVASDGTVYEGLGWDLAAFRPRQAQSKYGNFTLDIAYIGNFKNSVPSVEMADAAAELVLMGMELNKVVDRPVIHHLHDFRDFY